ncbi:MAG TPA: SufE family protein, partial [Arenibaculum sp.]|nr:SufE family protein [Arenibaculum sp.]
MQIEELKENFSLFDEWEDRYRYLIDLGRSMPPLEA